jgi:hypothetical protein
VQRRANKAIVTTVALLAAAPGIAVAKTPAHFLPFGLGKERVAKFTKAECLGERRCKSQVRHCVRWAPNQVACQSELLFWARGEAKVKVTVNYCHWQSLAWWIRAKPIEIWSDPKPTCQRIHGEPRWPVRPGKHSK